MAKLNSADRAAKVSATEAERRRAVAMAGIRELELAEKEGRLVPADQVADAWGKVAGKLRDAVLRIPDKCAPSAHAADTVQEARAGLMTECESILRTLHDDLLGTN